MNPKEDLMAKTTNLTKAILVAMGATATAAAGASTLESGSLLELPAIDTAEYALADRRLHG